MPGQRKLTGELKLREALVQLLRRGPLRTRQIQERIGRTMTGISKCLSANPTLFECLEFHPGKGIGSLWHLKEKGSDDKS